MGDKRRVVSYEGKELKGKIGWIKVSIGKVIVETVMGFSECNKQKSNGSF